MARGDYLLTGRLREREIVRGGRQEGPESPFVKGGEEEGPESPFVSGGQSDEAGGKLALKRKKKAEAELLKKAYARFG